MKIINLLGRRFQRLIVTERVDDYISPKGEHKVRWLCTCDCGNQVKVTTSDLLRQHSTSCGCKKADNMANIGIKSRHNLVGHRFGKLTVIEFSKSRRHLGAYWLCKCDCGNEKIAMARGLKNGDIISCGCSRESLIASQLKQYFVEFYGAICEYRLIKNPLTGRFLLYDIYLPSDNTFIEINGNQHYEMNNWHSRIANSRGTTSAIEFKRSKNRDAIKKEFAEKAGNFIEVNINTIKTTKSAIEYIESIIVLNKENNGK